MLNTQQIEQYRSEGFVVVEDVVSPEDIKQINHQIDTWVDESRMFTKNYGKLIDGQPRFDLEPGHSRAVPKLRRITNPIEISEHIRNVIIQGEMLKYLVPLLGPNIRYDHSKINAKYQGMTSDVKFHQDHIFEPQTNDSVTVAMLMLDDTTVANGCLRIIPGSHRTRYSHSKNGVFTGRVEERFYPELDNAAENIEAKSGSLCLMDTWAVHGSAMNLSNNPRRVLITEYKSADAHPMTIHKLPSRWMDSVIHGDELAPRYRVKQDFVIPETYEGDSLFDLQDLVESNRPLRSAMKA